MRINYLLICLLSTVSSVFGQYDEMMDPLFEGLENRPGAALGVFSKGELIWSKAYGLANLEHGVPINNQTVFDLGSVSKQFTAACILLLQQEGKLNIDDPIQKYLPEMPVYHQETVTIRHLLNHTSGLRDYVEINAYAGVPFENIFTEEMGLEIMARQEDRSFKPGKQFLYNNGNYLLLAIIIRRTSGQSIGEYAKQHIFEPLGMDATFILENPHRAIKNGATGYVPNSDGYYDKRHYTNIAIGGDGQVYSTINDLLLWDANAYHKKVGGEQMYQIMETRGILNSGKKTNYGTGVFVDELNGNPMVMHLGAWGGFRALLYRFPEKELSIAVLMNGTDVLSIGGILGLLNTFMPPKMENTKLSIQSKAIEVPKPILKKYTGTFQVLGMPHLQMNISLVKDTLIVKNLWNDGGFQLIPNSETEFYQSTFPKVTYVFNRNTGALLVNERIEVWNTQRIDPTINVPNKDLKPYQGQYYSKEVGAVYEVTLEEGQLVVYRGRKKLYTLRPVSKHIFADGFAGFEFKGQNGKINEFLLQDRRVRNLQFVKE
ncbi:MAG: hypothetical protein Sapg2KO_40980 [Saprospiraceae bacterium]